MKWFEWLNTKREMKMKKKAFLTIKNVGKRSFFAHVLQAVD